MWENASMIGYRSKPAPSYQAYLLRLRWVQKDGQMTCQVMLRGIDTQEQHFFADLESFVAFLKQEAELKDQADTPPADATHQ